MLRTLARGFRERPVPTNGPTEEGACEARVRAPEGRVGRRRLSGRDAHRSASPQCDLSQRYVVTGHQAPLLWFRSLYVTKLGSRKPEPSLPPKPKPPLSPGPLFQDRNFLDPTPAPRSKYSRREPCTRDTGHAHSTCATQRLTYYVVCKCTLQLNAHATPHTTVGIPSGCTS